MKQVVIAGWTQRDLQSGGAPLAQGERMEEDSARHKDGEELPRGHDGGKGECPVLLNGKADEELRSACAHTQREDLPNAGRVLSDEA